MTILMSIESFDGLLLDLLSQIFGNLANDSGSVGFHMICASPCVQKRGADRQHRLREFRRYNVLYQHC